MPRRPKPPEPGEVKPVKFSFIIPSRDRPEGLCRAIESIYATTKGHDVEIIAVLDEPDSASRLMLQQYPEVEVVVGGPGDAYLGKPQDKYNLGYAASTGDWIVAAADDITFETPGWLDDALRANRGGFVGLPDGGQDPRWVCVLLMATRWYIENVMRGHFGLEWYHVWWADVEWAERARQIGLYTYLNPKVFKMTHHHWLRSGNRVGGAEKDGIYKLAETLVAEDQITYGRRSLERFARDE